MVMMLNCAVAKAQVIPAISIDSSGKVGINTQSPTAQLEVNGSTNLKGTTHIKSTYSVCTAAGDKTADCGVQDMCGMSYFQALADHNVSCTLYVAIDPNGGSPAWTLKATRQTCSAVCVRYQ